ncbi:MAG TPA: Ig-like domain-containing protein [Steroidobacteraceae bacterium]
MSSSQHKFLSWLLTGSAVLTASLSGCAGNGAGLDSSGAPIGSGGGSTGGGPVTADFQSIQDNVFTPICSRCHAGGAAPEGLMLDAAHSYNLLVGVGSQEVPSLNRVTAGDPDSSYIIIKLTNGPGIVGAQMPYGLPPLPQATIDAIRQWIASGAPPPAAAAVSPTEAMQKLQRSMAQASSAAAFKVSFTSPGDRSIVDIPLRHIEVVFNREVDASLVNSANLTLERLDLTAQTGVGAQPLSIPSYLALAEGNASTVVITPVTPLLPGAYRVTARGSGGGVIADLNAQALAGDYSFTFTVDAAP